MLVLIFNYFNNVVIMMDFFVNAMLSLQQFRQLYL